MKMKDSDIVGLAHRGGEKKKRGTRFETKTGDAKVQECTGGPEIGAHQKTHPKFFPDHGEERDLCGAP